MEPFKRQKGEPTEALTNRLIKERAHGRCEYTWYENHLQKRCVELHGERAQGFAGIVQLIPMPTGGLRSSRVADLKCYCQKHAYALLDQMRQSIGYGCKRSAEDTRFQVDMFGAGI
jgi:hypothetical protein